MRFDSRQIAPVKPGRFNEHLSLWRNRASGVPVSALHVRRAGLSLATFDQCLNFISIFFSF